MLDHLITELDNRFEEEAASIVGELAQILPSEFCSASFQRGFKDDLSSAKALHTELDLWQTKRKSETVKAKQLDTKGSKFC